MRNLSGHFYLHGDWRVSPPSSEAFAGTVFQYGRGRVGFFGPEQLRALGPTTEPLYLVVSSIPIINESLYPSLSRYWAYITL